MFFSVEESLSKNIIQDINGTTRFFESREGIERDIEHWRLWGHFQSKLLSKKDHFYS